MSGHSKWRVVELTKGFVTIVSKEDHKKVMKYSWRVSHSGGRGRKLGRPYARGSVKGKDTYLHRFITPPQEEGHHIDHINHCTLDNRRENLRSVTPRENMKHKRNRRKR